MRWPKCLKYAFFYYVTLKNFRPFLSGSVGKLNSNDWITVGFWFLCQCTRISFIFAVANIRPKSEFIFVTSTETWLDDERIFCTNSVHIECLMKHLIRWTFAIKMQCYEIVQSNRASYRIKCKNVISFVFLLESIEKSKWKVSKPFNAWKTAHYKLPDKIDRFNQIQIKIAFPMAQLYDDPQKIERILSI